MTPCAAFFPSMMAVARVTSSSAESSAVPVTAGELRQLFSLLVGSAAGGSRFLFTSRVDFEVVEAGRLSSEIGRVSVGEGWLVAVTEG